MAARGGRHRAEPVPDTATLITEIGRALMIMALVVVLSLAAWVLVPMTWGWTAYTVTSGSMAPLVRPGDVVVASGRPRTVEVGALVVLTPERPDGEPITHRVVEALPDGTFRTRGDANPQPDTRLVRIDQIAGRARLVVPLAGLIQLHTGRAAPVAGLALILVSLLLPAVRRRRRPVKPVLAAGLACAVTMSAGTAGASWATSRAAFTGTTDAAQSWATSLTYENAVLATGPVSYWRMGTTGTVADATGLAPMSLLNSPTLQIGALRGDTDRALRFYRTNPSSYGTVTATAHSFTGPFTVAAWVSATGGANQRVVFKGNTASVNYLLAFDSTGKYMRFVMDAGTRITAIDPALWPATGWHFVAGVYNGATARLYVDGAQVASVNVTNPPAGSTLALTVSEPGAPGSALLGDVDEVAVWNKALTATQVQNLYGIGRK